MSKTARNCTHHRVMGDADSVWRSCHDFKVRAFVRPDDVSPGLGLSGGAIAAGLK